MSPEPPADETPRPVLPAGSPDPLSPPSIPACLREEVERAIERYEQAATAADEAGWASIAASQQKMVTHLFACSPFSAAALARDPGLLPAMLGRPGADDAAARPDALADPEGDEKLFEADLRRYRRRRMVALVWQSLCQPSSTPRVMRATSDLADECLRLAVARAEQAVAVRHGVPRDGEGRRQHLITLAMGKLGGRELNFSSDIDVIFLFRGVGATDGRRSLSSEEYFARVTQRVARYLDQRTAEGFVFRLDTRLRPFGASGSPVHSLAALESYLQSHARAWERYAYVRARPVTGPADDGAAVLALLRPFVYRRYLDFGVLESVREIRALINAEVHRRERLDDLKLGPGGIREIEFIVQTYQVLHGGRDRRLRQPGTLDVLDVLVDLELLEPPVAERLRSAYLVLRRAENALQMARDEQIHSLPTTAIDQARLACHLGARDWSAVRTQLDEVRAVVSAEFANAVVHEDARRPTDSLVGVSRGEIGAEESARHLEAAGVASAEAVVALLARLRESVWYSRLTQIARERLDALLPLLLGTVSKEEADLDALRRVLDVLEAIGSRSAYFALLAENEQARTHLVRLCRLGPVIAAHLVQSPALIDELIDPALFNELPTRESLREELHRRLDGLEPDDAEAWMDSCRLFQQAAVFQVAVGDLLGRAPVAQVSDLLTDVAELLLEHTLAMARHQLGARHGTPRSAGRQVPFAIVGYGKLGGLELGYGSDLDVVFLHEVATGSTDGPAPLDNPVYFVRLAQRVIHLLSTPTTAGVLYRVDTRLRPSGNAGLLVSSLDAFADYQRRDAWTWEHQALLRARAVAGDPPLREQFEQVRRSVLCQPRDVDRLREDVAQMRARMRAELSVAAPGCFDIKQDSGGLVDLEFLVQYLVLANAHRMPDLVAVRDNAAQLRRLADAGLLPREQAGELIDAYYTLRQLAHHASLRGEPAVITAGDVDAAAAAVAGAFDQHVGAPSGGPA